jgi:hypothetical protein
VGNIPVERGGQPPSSQIEGKSPSAAFQGWKVTGSMTMAAVCKYYCINSLGWEGGKIGSQKHSSEDDDNDESSMTSNYYGSATGRGLVLAWRIKIVELTIDRRVC